MNIEIFTLCDAAADYGGRLNLLGTFDTIYAQQFPVAHPHCAVALRVSFDRIEEGDHPVRISIVDEDGKSIGPGIEGGITVKFPADLQSVSANMVLNINGMTFAHAGRYAIDLAIDNRHEKSLPLTAVQVEHSPTRVSIEKDRPMAGMTSRERVLRTVNFQDTDRVPIDLGAMKASGIGVKAYNRIKAGLGVQTPTRIWDPKFMIASVEEEVMRRLHLDVVPLDVSSAVYDGRPDSEWIPSTLYDGAEGLLPPGTQFGTDSEGRWALLDQSRNPTPFRMPRAGYYFDDISFNEPGASIDPAAFRPVTGFTDEQLAAVQARGKFLHDNTDYAILGWGGGVCFLGLSLITDRLSNVTMGLPSEWMVMLMTEKETCHEMMDRSVEASIQCLRQLHDATGDYCFAWGIAADDSGTQRSEFINPELWVEMIKPHYAKLCAWIHRNTHWKTFLHSCGSIYHLIPHMIEAGVDILNPIQTSAANMEPERLKREFGGKIVFWGGGCDTQRVLGTSTPEEIRGHVRQRLEVFKPGGGYVFNQVHNIQPNVPAESVIAMLDAAYEYG